MPRNNKKLIQCSVDALRSWRANCDVRIFVYESDPNWLDANEITRVTDYTVGYSCKGHQKQKDEKDQTISFVNNYTEMTGDVQDVTRLSRQLLNKATTNRVISKQESMVLLLNLNLVKCTDVFTNVSTNGRVRIALNRKNRKNKDIQDSYAERCLADPLLRTITLHQFFHRRYNQTPGMKKTCWNIPIYKGSAVKPVYPPSRKYAESMFYLHRPWHRKFYFADTNWRNDLERFMYGGEAPPVARIGYERAVIRFHEFRPEVTAKETEEIDNPDQEDEELKVLTSHDVVVDNFDNENIDVLDRGLCHDWKIHNIDLTKTCCDGKTFLEVAVKAESETKHHGLDLPKKMGSDGCIRDFEIADLHPDQRRVMAYVLSGLYRWIENDTTFDGMRLTVRGRGGSGKTVLLKTITSVVRRMFNTKTAALVSGPTGACSCNAGGCTDHYLFGINPNNQDSFSISDGVKEKMVKQFQDTVVLLLDERSMRSSKLLVKMESVARECAHGGFHTQNPWGGIPIVIQFGDDNQLPSCGSGASCMPIPGHPQLYGKKDDDSMLVTGNLEFLNFGKDVMDLPTIKRQKDSERKLKQLLNKTRQDALTESDALFLKQFHLESDFWDKHKVFREWLRHNALHVFANNAPKDKHNFKMLQHVSSREKQPVAFFRSKFTRTMNSNTKTALRSHFTNPRNPNISRLCVGAKVCIAGRNFMPKWGLYNGAIGKVVSFHFDQNMQDPNPNNGDLPDFIVVAIPHYKGPTWHEDHPTHVPIPLCHEICSRGCCAKQYVPLQLCFATTIHKIQGLSIGPTGNPSEPVNPAQMMVIDVGSSDFEKKNPGTFYVTLSRATTLGQGDITKSAIFFDGPNFTIDRLTNLTCYKRTNRKTVTTLRREAWVEFLDKHVHDGKLSTSKIEQTLEWALKTRFPTDWIKNKCRQTAYQSCVD